MNLLLQIGIAVCFPTMEIIASFQDVKAKFIKPSLCVAFVVGALEGGIQKRVTAASLREDLCSYPHRAHMSGGARCELGPLK